MLLSPDAPLHKRDLLQVQNLDGVHDNVQASKQVRITDGQRRHRLQNTVPPGLSGSRFRLGEYCGKVAAVGPNFTFIGLKYALIHGFISSPLK